MSHPSISGLQKMRDYFNSGATRTFTFRREQLLKLKSALSKYENDLHDALYADLWKSPEECWVTETGFLLSEINAALKHLRQWMQPEKAGTNLLNLPSKSFVLKEPLGVVMIIGPWNYPLQLLFTPMVGAIAAGNCIVLKPSEFAPATMNVMGKIVSDTFPPEYIAYITGDGAEVVPAMMNGFRFDHVFYTGSIPVGKLIYKMAAEKLVPVTLELGGKSPCVVEDDANLKVAARRIAVSRFSNAGQMCVAPDYVLVHESARNSFLDKLIVYIRKFYGDKASESYNYGRMVNQKQFDRVVSYLDEGKILYGGDHDRASLYIEPSIIDLGKAEDIISRTETMPLEKLLTDEIFGPVLPIISYRSFEAAKSLIEYNPEPLAFYVFTSDNKKEKRWLTAIPFGGACVNNTSWHLTNHNLPFGGKGNSGIGHYHGQYSFETFSHQKAVMKTPTWFDPDIKYPPFKGKMGLFKKVIR